ncbi:hypothetical protein CC80DRAFT_545995 [Byssothecium circinans]|uniref:Uncharacterized protein n=1 Tax=Byssothecium circinans TaxID=147558 RepID=A0A6A5UC44_9PLEO|nr:hypothetical protein CC80DRAFT_545995 [Byssothecium circinans]
MPATFDAPVVLARCFYNGTEEEESAFYENLIAVGALVNTIAMIPHEKLNSLLNHAAGFNGRKMLGGGAVKPPLDAKFVQSLFDEFMGYVNGKEGIIQSL